MIRKLEKRDVCRVAEIQVFGWRSAYRGILPDEYLYVERTVEKLLPFWYAKVESKDSDDWVFINDEDGMVKGIVTSGMSRDEEFPDAFELWGLYVEPLMKGGGVGTQLVQHCEELGRKAGCKQMVIWAIRDNEAAIPFYEKLGYRLDGGSRVRPPVTVMQHRFIKDL